MEESGSRLFTELKKIGVDVDGTISRFMDNSEIYITFLKRFPDEDRLTPVKAAVSEKDSEKLTLTAHKLKGVSANLGMTALSEAAYKIELKAKAGSFEETDEDLKLAEELHTELCRIIRENT